MEEEERGAMEFDVDAPLAQAFKRKRKARPKRRKPQARPNEPPEAAHDLQPPIQSPACAELLTMDASPEIAVSEFDYSVENHFQVVDTIAKLCGLPETLDANHAEIKRFSNSITFLREWRDFNYAPLVVRFACQHNSKEKGVNGGIILPPFSSASVPKEMQNGSQAGTESSKDFVMHVGGAVWALDWCPRVDSNSENHIKPEFVAVAAHPPESSYHKIGAPLTGRGAIQIWCLLTVYVKEDVPSQGNKKSRPNSQKKGTVKFNEQTKLKRPRGRPRKKSLDDSAEKTNTDSQNVQPLAIEYHVDSAETINTDSQNVQPLAVEYPMGSSRSYSLDRTSGNASEHVCREDSARTPEDLNQTEHANAFSLTAHRGNRAKAGKDNQVHNKSLHILRPCEHGESAIVNSLASANFSLNSVCPEKKIYISSCDANTSKHSIPKDVALPRMMLCLAHNGKVAWDIKWRPANACDPESMNIMGYLAVLLGNGALEVWEVPLPHSVKPVYPACRECIDPRFIKLQPVFRCSMLKCGDRQSIPQTVEWSVLSPHDMILAGCHDGVVALWKFSVTDSLTETRPLLSFSADTGPIRTLAWAPIQSDLESANVIVTAGHKGFKFWDIRDPFRPLWDHPMQGVTYSLDWLPDPRCVFGSIDDGTLWLLSLEKAAHDIPVTGKSLTATPKQGFHNFDCSSFSIWSIQASRLTGVVAYCGEEGTTLCFQPTGRSVKDPSRNHLYHFLCGSLLQEEHALIVGGPLINGLVQKRAPGMKRSGAAKDQEKRAEEQMAMCRGSSRVEEHGSDNSSILKTQTTRSKQTSKSQLKVGQETLPLRSEDSGNLQGEITIKEKREEDYQVLPPKIVAMHRVRWNVNKGSEKWLSYGGAAGLVRCQEVDLSIFSSFHR